MTNGEKIKEIFPNIIKYGNILIDDTGALQKNILFDDTWWNAEYKEPTTKNDLGVDCISRQAVLNLPRKTLKNYFGEVVGEVVYVKDIMDLPSVTPQEPKWIPVSERLPNHDEYIKNNGLFNVSDGNRSYSEWFDIYEKQKFGEPTMSGFCVDYAVTHWMPLPQPYREVEE